MSAQPRTRGIERTKEKKKPLTAGEKKALEAMLRECEPFCNDDFTVLLPRQHFHLPLDGDTPEERMEELQYKCSEIFEAVMASDNQPVPKIDFTFVRWFCKVIRTEFSPQRMLQELERVVRKRYYSSKG